MTPRLLAALTLATGAFLLRGAFYCALTPAWEGFDEWAHFARAQALASGQPAPQRASPIQPEISRSLTLLPLPKHSYLPAGALTHDQFWRLPPAERQARRHRLFEPSSSSSPSDPAARHYQAQQPPLYYLPMALLLRAVPRASLPARLLLLRLATLLLAASAIPLCFFAARAAFSNLSTSLAASLAAASLPCLLIVTCRVSGDALFIALSSAAVLLALLAARRNRRLHWALLGLSIAAALLTKATALVLLALIPAAALVRRPALRLPALALLIAALASPWYFNTWLATSTLTGEQTHAAVAATSLATRLQTAASLPWLRIADCAAFSHIWIGGWSFLVLRSWMYRVVEILAAVAASGVFFLALRRARTARRLAPALALFALLLAALAWHAVAVRLSGAAPAVPGWYLAPALAAELILFGWGFAALLGPRAATAALCLLAALSSALDLYSTAFLLAPHYSGLMPPASAFPWRAYLDPAQIAEMLRRLTLFDPSFITPSRLAALWAAYLAATLLLVAFALRLAYSTISAPNPRSFSTNRS